MRQFTSRTVNALAAQVSSGTALLRATSRAEKARPAVSLAADMRMLWENLVSGGSLATTADLVLNADGITVVPAHRAILQARSGLFDKLLRDQPTSLNADAPLAVSVPDASPDELRGAVQMCYTGTTDQERYFGSSELLS